MKYRWVFHIYHDCGWDLQNPSVYQLGIENKGFIIFSYLHIFCKSLALNIVTYILHNVIEVTPLRPETVNIVMYIFQDYLFGQILDECILDHDAHIVR